MVFQGNTGAISSMDAKNKIFSTTIKEKIKDTREFTKNGDRNSKLLEAESSYGDVTEISTDSQMNSGKKRVAKANRKAYEEQG